MRASRPADKEQGYQRIGALALAAAGLLFAWRSIADLPFGTIDNPGPGITPFALALLLVFFALWIMMRGPPGLLSRAEAETDDGADPGAIRHAVLVIAGIVAAAPGFAYLGYRLTILLLLLFYLGAVERKPILITLIVSIVIAIGSHALFVHVLRISLPSGPWGL
jgi:Tripartite tricarboxylate transporter TctB family